MVSHSCLGSWKCVACCVCLLELVIYAWIGMHTMYNRRTAKIFSGQRCFIRSWVQRVREDFFRSFQKWYLMPSDLSQCKFTQLHAISLWWSSVCVAIRHFADVHKFSLHYFNTSLYFIIILACHRTWLPTCHFFLALESVREFWCCQIRSLSSEKCFVAVAMHFFCVSQL